MSMITRRGFVRSTAVAGAATLAATHVAGAASGTFSVPNLIRAQNAPVEIDFYHIWGTPVGEQAPDEIHPSVRVIDLFNESQSDIKVNSVTVGGYPETLQKAQAEMAAGKAPALVITPWAFLYPAQGLGIQDLGALYGDDVSQLMDLINPAAHPLVTTEDGAILGVPYAFSTPIWYYNADVFEQAGVDPVAAMETWDTLAEAAPAIQEALGGTPVFGFTTNRDWPAQTIIQSNGGKIVADGVPVMDSPEAQAAMQVVADLDAAGFHDNSARSETANNWFAGVTALRQGSVASLRSVRNEASFNFGTVPFPMFEGKPRQSSVGGSFIGMYAREQEQQDAAWEYMKFALSEEAYTIWSEIGYLNISTHDLPIVEGQEAAYTQFEEGLTPETQWPSDRGVEASGVWDVYCERIWANDISVEEGTEAAVEEISAIIGL